MFRLGYIGDKPEKAAAYVCTCLGGVITKQLLRCQWFYIQYMLLYQ